jgi:hypothetical protein
MTANKPKIGDTVYYLDYGRVRRDRAVLETGTLTGIGTKYYTVAHESGNWDMKFCKQRMSLHEGRYGFGRTKLFLAEQDFLDEQERKKLWNEIQVHARLSKFGHKAKLEQLRQVAGIFREVLEDEKS